MTLSALIRKRAPRNLATAIPAISATQPKGEDATVAGIATVAVASPKEEKTAPPAKVGAGNSATVPIGKASAELTGEEESSIRAWLDLINETDPANIADVLTYCQHNLEARAYFTGRAATELAGHAMLHKGGHTG
jgi:hypothetical protein